MTLSDPVLMAWFESLLFTLSKSLLVWQALFARHDQQFDVLHEHIRGVGEMARVMGDETRAQNEYVVSDLQVFLRF